MHTSLSRILTHPRMSHSFQASSERRVLVNCKIENNVGIGTNHRELPVDYFTKGRLQRARIVKCCYQTSIFGVTGAVRTLVLIVVVIIPIRLGVTSIQVGRVMEQMQMKLEWLA